MNSSMIPDIFDLGRHCWNILEPDCFILIYLMIRFCAAGEQRSLTLCFKNKKHTVNLKKKKKSRSQNIRDLLIIEYNKHNAMNDWYNLWKKPLLLLLKPINPYIVCLISFVKNHGMVPHGWHSQCLNTSALMGTEKQSKKSCFHYNYLSNKSNARADTVVYFFFLFFFFNQIKCAIFWPFCS